MYLREIADKIYANSLSALPRGKILINTMNAYSFCLLQRDKKFQKAILNSDFILADGVSIVWAIRVLKGIRLKKVAGADLFLYEMKRLQKKRGKCFFLGSTEDTLSKICDQANINYPEVEVRHYSPPFKKEFSAEENRLFIEEINSFDPDVLFIGMTAPKQEIWGEMHFSQINAKLICGIGAVFDFFAQTKKRAPAWMIKIHMEWFYRLLLEPKRTWRRYLYGNPLFVMLILKEKFCMILENLRVSYKKRN